MTTSNKFTGVNQKPKVSPWKLKNKNIDVNELNPTLYSYLSNLPKDIQEGITITAGKEPGHSISGGHGKGNAVDIRLEKKDDWDSKMMDYLYNDSETRKNLGIAFLNPEHGGTAPHIHLSIGVAHEIANDYYYGKNAVKPYVVPENTPDSNGIINLPDGTTTENSKVVEDLKNLPAYTPIVMPKSISVDALLQEFTSALAKAKGQGEGTTKADEKDKTDVQNRIKALEEQRAAQLELINKLSLNYETN